MVAHYLINPDMRHNLDTLSKSYLNYSPISIESLIGKRGKNQGSMRDVSIEKLTDYAAEDADLTLQLKQIFDEEMKTNQVEEIFWDIEVPMIRVLADMEKEGISIDSTYLNNLDKVFESELDKLKSGIFEKSGEEFNLNSPKQLGDILFDKLKLVSKPKKTKTGQYSTSEEVLSSLANEHEIIRSILEWRSLDKLQNTYVRSLPNEVSSRTGRIHTKFNQTVTTTGRLSSNNPNLQNIPIRTENGQKIREAFIPKNQDFELLAADYSQIELRVIASISKDKSMIDAFVKNQDIHTITASKIYNADPENITREQRGNAKTVNFGIIYGVSAFGLSQQTNLSRSESKIMIDNYFENTHKITYMKLSGVIDNSTSSMKNYFNDFIRFVTENKDSEVSAIKQDTGDIPTEESKEITHEKDKLTLTDKLPQPDLNQVEEIESNSEVSSDAASPESKPQEKAKTIPLHGLIKLSQIHISEPTILRRI